MCRKGEGDEAPENLACYIAEAIASTKHSTTPSPKRYVVAMSCHKVPRLSGKGPKQRIQRDIPGIRPLQSWLRCIGDPHNTHRLESLKVQLEALVMTVACLHGSFRRGLYVNGHWAHGQQSQAPQMKESKVPQVI